jgi:hypothetical protein
VLERWTCRRMIGLQMRRLGEGQHDVSAHTKSDHAPKEMKSGSYTLDRVRYDEVDDAIENK